MHSATRTPILVGFELYVKKATCEKVNSLISYGNNERTNFFSTQARPEILFDLESTCHVEL